MTDHKRSVAGNVGSGSGGVGRRSEKIAATPESAAYTRLPRPWKYWISHRQGPFLIHSTEDCDPKAMGCYNSYDNLVGQGFMSCPKCTREEE